MGMIITLPNYEFFLMIAWYIYICMLLFLLLLIYSYYFFLEAEDGPVMLEQISMIMSIPNILNINNRHVSTGYTISSGRRSPPLEKSPDRTDLLG